MTTAAPAHSSRYMLSPTRMNCVCNRQTIVNNRELCGHHYFLIFFFLNLATLRIYLCPNCSNYGQHLVVFAVGCFISFIYFVEVFPCFAMRYTIGKSNCSCSTHPTFDSSAFPLFPMCPGDHVHSIALLFIQCILHLARDECSHLKGSLPGSYQSDFIYCALIP